MAASFTFTAPLWRWTAREESADGAAWCFVTLPLEVADEVRERSGEPRGFGSVRVHVEAAGTAWDTSVFPDASSGSFALPVKKAIRVAADVGEGDDLTVTLSLRDPRDPSPPGRDRPRRHPARTPTAPSPPARARCSTSSTPTACPSSSPPAARSAGWRSCGTPSAATGWRSAATAGSCTTSPRAGCATSARCRARSGSRWPSWCARPCPGTTFAIEHTSRLGERGRLPAPPRRRRDAARRARGSRSTRDDVVKVLAVHRDLDPEDFWRQVEEAVGDPGHHDVVLDLRARRDQRRRRHQGHHARPGRRRDGPRRRGRRRLRRHAQRPADARVGRHVVRDGQRARVRARPRRPPRARATTTTAWPWCWPTSSASLARLSAMSRAVRLAAALLLACLGLVVTVSAPASADCTCKQGELEQAGRRRPT